jgi:hypothetical protein
VPNFAAGSSLKIKPFLCHDTFITQINFSNLGAKVWDFNPDLAIFALS